MRLATLQSESRDGRLCVVSADGARALLVPEVAPNLQAALDAWAQCEPLLRQAQERLNEDGALGEPLDVRRLAAPLPRGYAFLDGSAYLNHVELVRKARGAEMPPSFLDDPLMYQAASDGFMAPTEPIRASAQEHGIDLEAEIGAIVDDVPQGTPEEQAGAHIRLLVLINDVSLRALVPAELGKGFGFLQSKPRSALSPFAVTPDELGDAWRDYVMHLPMRTWLNGDRLGDPDCGTDVQFSLARLIAHGARTRPLAAGTLVGSGTISNRDRSRGVACLAEIRMIETIEKGQPETPFLRFGDRVAIEVTDAAGRSVFGRIEQTVQPVGDGA